MQAALPDTPTVARLRARKPLLWINPEADNAVDDEVHIDVAAAEARMDRAQPLLQTLFPETSALARPTFSPLLPANALYALNKGRSCAHGRWYIKADHALPVAGSVKARGGFHEVIAHAERLAELYGVATPGGDLIALASPSARELFSRHSISVGSTGNLGLSIGLIAAALGFEAIVHMSKDAKAWKKQRLRDRGVTVVEHEGDYALAVAQGRQAASQDPNAHFVDDERSIELFVGYAAAARELVSQLAAQTLDVDVDHPLFVYIPCGVGGAPGGITFGLKRIFGPDVHVFFAEPTASPCMLVQMLAGDTPTSVYDLGLDNHTEADGLAVAQASMFVAPLMRKRLGGVYTVFDNQMFALLRHAHEAEQIDLEPSAAAALAGPIALMQTESGRAYLSQHRLWDRMSQATHVMWTTGGALVPVKEREKFLQHAQTVDPAVQFDP